jgi:hypothetical protein
MVVGWAGINLAARCYPRAAGSTLPSPKHWWRFEQPVYVPYAIKKIPIIKITIPPPCDLPTNNGGANGGVPNPILPHLGYDPRVRCGDTYHRRRTHLEMLDLDDVLEILEAPRR